MSRGGHAGGTQNLVGNVMRVVFGLNWGYIGAILGLLVGLRSMDFRIIDYKFCKYRAMGLTLQEPSCQASMLQDTP